MDAVEVIRQLERQPAYRLLEVLRFGGGRRYIYRLTGDREYLVHVVVFRGETYVEFWHDNFAVPLLVFKVVGGEELNRLLLLLRTLTGANR